MAKILITTRDKIHQELCLSLQQFLEARNWTSLASILQQLPDGATKKKVIIWIEKFSPLRLKTTIPKIRFAISNELFDAYESATDSPYWEMPLPNGQAKKSSLKKLLTTSMHEFIKDPSETNHHNLTQVIESYKKFGVSPVKNSLKITPTNLVQGGMPGTRR